ncbi:thiol-disulfide oxidoreductase DCC family protein [Persicobacter sp. CCB-QB2]|uniref:thiol-disulfide oxidoreductase DCC family protein n=1 Tax=Persicobacter sp. CCB-QB2 TaxID=1561025 RepID=UPI0006A96851|nr:thiol-disulfide oxidoreductase DCC family protein [Persicobacter sp. CCB-QB2]
MGEDRKMIVLFDGVCNLCSWAVNFIIDHDPDKKFVFASLQSQVGQKLLKEVHHPAPAELDSVVLIQGNQWYEKSEAAVRVARHLKFPVNLLSLGFILPKFIRDFMYDFIAQNRYRWFGKQDSCRLPNPELQQRFL